MIVAGTGHRPDKLGGYGDIAFWRLKDLARDWLEDNKPELVISGMALGWDQALALAAHEVGIPFHVYIPFTGQENKWPLVARYNFQYLTSKAEKVIECSEPGYAVWKMQHRNKCMVDIADVVLAMWNGTDGGTANCVRYAEKQGKEIINLYPAYQAKLNAETT